MCLLRRFVALCRKEGLNTRQRKRKARGQSGSELAFQIAEERREEKGQGEWERHIQLNAVFRRIVRRDKKVLLNEQCKEVEENKRMGKMRSLGFPKKLLNSCLSWSIYIALYKCLK